MNALCRFARFSCFRYHVVLVEFWCEQANSSHFPTSTYINLSKIVDSPHANMPGDDKKKEKKHSFAVSIFGVQEKLVKTFDTLVITPTSKATHKVGDLFKQATSHTKDVKLDKTLNAAFKLRVKQAKAGAYRLKDVFAQPLIMDMAYTPPNNPKAPAEEEFLQDALNNSFVFSNMTYKERMALLKAFEAHDVSTGTTIIQQNDVGDYYYIIQLGTVQIRVDDKAVGTATEGEAFGELALLYNCPRAATCVALTDCKLWRIDQRTFRRVLAKFNITKDDETKALLENVGFLKDLDDKLLTKMAFALGTKHFEAGEIMVKKGDPVKYFWIIKEGKVKATDISIGNKEYDDITFGHGDYFNEAAILNNDRIYGTVTTLEKTTALCLSAHAFTKIFGGLDKLMERSSDKKALVSFLILPVSCGVVIVDAIPILDEHAALSFCFLTF
jgi:cAMP-dependent protein kinase regulator